MNPTPSGPEDLAGQARRAFASKQLDRAADLFRQAAEGYRAAGEDLMAAEMQNNRSVALLQAGSPQAALEAVQGTDERFAAAGDLKRQGMALGNLAAALEGLGRMDEAMRQYDLAAEVFGRAGEGDLRALVMKSSAAVKWKTGRIADSAFKMIGSLDSKDHPSLFERALKFLLRFIR